MRNRPLLPALLLSLAVLTGCGDKPSDKPATPPSEPAYVPPSPPPDRVELDHILIGVKQPNPRAAGFKRNAEEAKTVANDLFAKLKGGADWAAAKREFSEDPPPGGPYALANSNKGVQPANQSEYPRSMMAPAFGDVGFSLPVGGIGLAPFDPDSQTHRGTSPFGYHIIKRIK